MPFTISDVPAAIRRAARDLAEGSTNIRTSSLIFEKLLRAAPLASLAVLMVCT
jgi:hypothetical protein